MWAKNLYRYFSVRQMTKQNITVPLITLIVSTPSLSKSKHIYEYELTILSDCLVYNPSVLAGARDDELQHDGQLAPGTPTQTLALQSQ